MNLLAAFEEMFASHDTDDNPHLRQDNEAIWTGHTTHKQIDENLLLSIPAAYDAINAIVNPIKTLPLVFFERVSKDEKKRIEPSEVGLNLAEPNEFQNQVEFFDFMMRNLLIYNNAFAEIISDNNGKIQSYIPFHPNHVMIRKIPTGFVYVVTTGFGQRTIVPDRMWHIKSGPYDETGMMGIGPIVKHRETLIGAWEVLDYGRRFFKNDAQPGGVLETDKVLSDEARRNLKTSWKSAQGGKNKLSTAILEEGLKYNPTDVQNDKAQFIETRKNDAIDIARIWNVPPHRIKSLDDATYSNIEQQALEYVVHSLSPWFAVLEKSIKSSLIGIDNNIFVEFNVLGLLRGDIKARYDAYSKARNWGWLSVNEIRKLENLNPIDEGGDIYLQPLNTRDVEDDDEDDDKKKTNNSLKLIKDQKNA